MSNESGYMPVRSVMPYPPESDFLICFTLNLMKNKLGKTKATDPHSGKQRSAAFGRNPQISPAK